ncbi:MAG: glycosyltransferase family 1 protein [Pseudomonadota bacterium]
MAAFDLLVVSDARFQGGTTAAMVSDVRAFSALGARIGLMFVRSAYLDDSSDPVNPAALALADLDGVTLLAPDSKARAGTAFLHHPLVFFRGIEECAEFSADRAVLVTHHAPFRADGSLEYDPVAVCRRAWRALGLAPWFAPVSGIIRAQLQSFAPLIRLTSEDWPNTFDTDAWRRGPPILEGGRITVGRHGRADALKWPATAAEISASLPAGAGVRVRVLGCPEAELTALGVDLSGWEVLAFGAETPQDFLHALDVFVYHYSPNWVEAFGRTVAEAALCGRLCLLDPRLEATFGEIGLYCRPGEVAAVLDRLRTDPSKARARAARGEELARTRYGLASVAARLNRLRADRGDTGRTRPDTPPLQTARKLVGLYRRRARGGAG